MCFLFKVPITTSLDQNGKMFSGYRLRNLVVTQEICSISKHVPILCFFIKDLISLKLINFSVMLMT